MLVARHTSRMFALLLVVCCLATQTVAQPVLNLPSGGPIAGQAPEEQAPPAEPIAKKRAENAELLRVAQRKLDAASPTDPDAAQDVALFKTVEAALARQEAVQTEIEDLKARQKTLKADLQVLRASGVDPSTRYSFPQFYQLKDELAAEQARMTVTAAKVGIATADLERATQFADERQRKRRLAQEALDTAKDGDDTAELATAADQAVQAVKLAEEIVTLRKLELQRCELSREVQALAVQLLEEKIARAAQHVSFSEDEFKQQQAKIKQQVTKIGQQLNSAEQQRTEAQNKWALAKKRIEEESGDTAVVAEQLEAWRRGVEKSQDEIELLNSQRQQLELLRLAWTRRYQIANTPVQSDSSGPPDEWNKWRRQTKDMLQELARQSRAQIDRLDLVRKDIATVTKKLDGAKEGPPESVVWIDRQRTYLGDLLSLNESHLVAIESSRRVHEKLIDDIDQRVQPTSLKQWAVTASQPLLSGWESVWKYELYHVGDPPNDRPITVQKLVTALLIFIVGLTAARMLAALFAFRMLKRVRLSKDATAVIKTLAFYILLLVVVLAALKWAEVPLTAFTILGGALAIGVGFGSQAIINNFLSGLIMLAERPVRLGERIVFGNYDGTVEEVGFRSTKLRTLTDNLVTIPNSSLINESIENIGRRRTIRRLMNVTITYDTPRDRVLAAVQAIRDILAEKGIREPIHPIVGFEQFPPRVYFNDYNAESLNIQVVYWYAPPDWWPYMEHSERVNMRIMEEFERLGVEFAFPSRTLYLAGDLRRELAVRLLPEQATQDAAGPYG
jgi:potassium efflux system protein